MDAGERAQLTGPPGTGLDPSRLFTGAMGRAILAHDWTGNPLGPPDRWSPALKGQVGMVLAASLPMVLFWGPAHVGLFNDAYADMVGPRQAGLLGRPGREGWASLWHLIEPVVERVMDGETITVRDRRTRADAGLEVHGRFLDLSYSPVYDSDGHIGGALCLMSDATERVRAQRHAEGEHARLARLFERAPGFMALLSEPGHVFAFANAAFRQLVGEREIIGRTVADALPETVEQGLPELLDRVVATGQPYSGRDLPLQLRRAADGATEQVILNFVYQPVPDDEGRITAIFVEGMDVTARARAEARLEVSEGALRLATEAGGIGIWDFDTITDELSWDDRTRGMFGIAPGTPCSMADFEAGLHPEDRARVVAAFAAALDPAIRSTYDVEYRTVGREDGVVRWVAARGRGLFDGQGTCVRALGTAVDITQHRAAAQRLRESEQRFRTVADTAPALIWMCDATGALVFANRWHEELFGRPLAELLGGGWQAILHPEDVDDFCAAFDLAFAARAPFGRDLRVIDRDGNIRWLHSEARPREVDGRFAGYVGCDVDVTEARLAAEELERLVAERTGELAASNRQLSAQIEERERVEATLAQMQRLEAVGQLTSGVAHDFNNLLTVVLGNLDLVARAARSGPLDERATQRLGTMRAAAERGAKLTAQLLAFSRRQRLESRAIDLNESVIGMRELIGSSMGGAVRLDVRPGEGLWPALVDPTQIELIILNLAINARDAMQVGGTLTVETANVSRGAPARPEEPGPGDYVMIAVADTGSGMVPEVRARAFEPFFTTKPVGKGSGLGLAQVFGFAKQSGGGVELETAEGRGTTVRVFLPRAAAQTPAAPTLSDVREGPLVARGRRVLLVDDDPPVREITAATLDAIGAEVVEAGSGGAALELLHQMDRRFDLLVADFAMPGMNGAELAAATTRLYPDLPVLFVTGYADLSALADVGEERIVQKPFRPGELQRKAAALLRRMAAA